ncbi:MAG: DUF1178 family protein [Hydrogenophilus sp.]|nr:DUF1178 family protein [Hydrogenophilus sp.]
MVVFDVVCRHGHRFEVWVPSAEEADRQIARGWLECPFCGSASVQRLPAAPAVLGTRGIGEREEERLAKKEEPVRAEEESVQALWRALQELRKRAEDVGRRFPEEVRRMHRGEASKRPIQGLATRGEVESLWEEGIAVFPLPPDPKSQH